MMTAAVLFWLCALGFSQLISATNLSQGLALVWVIALALTSIFFYTDLDLLGATILAVYTSVFLFLTLFGVYLSSYWAAAAAKTSHSFAPLFFLIAGGLVLFGSSGPTTSLGTVGWVNGYALAADTLFSPAHALHLIFYKLFVAETLLINLYLFLGLIVAAVTLTVFRAGSEALHNLGQPAFFNNLKVRTLRQFRRQTRRKNNTTARQKL